MSDANTNFRLNAEARRKLRYLGADYNITMSEVLRRIVLDFLAKNEAEQHAVLTQVGEER